MSYRKYEPLDVEIEDLANRQLTSPIVDDVPVWLIRLVCAQMDAPKRHPKQKSWTENMHYSRSYGPNYHTTTTTSPGWAAEVREKALARRGRKYVKEPDKGNLPNHDYRFWEGSRLGDVVRCRWCGAYGRTQEARIHHFKKAGLWCSHKLRRVYEDSLLQAIQYCFVCSKPTKNAAWGIPLCADVACLEAWKFDVFSSHREFSSRKTVSGALGRLNAFIELEANAKAHS